MKSLIAWGMAVGLTSMGISQAASAQTAAQGCAPLLQQGCVCVAPLTAGGTLLSTTGNVTLTGTAKFTPLPNGVVNAALAVGDGLIIGAGGVAVVNFGVTCVNFTVPSPAQAAVVSKDSNGLACDCLTIESRPIPAVLPHAVIIGGAAAAALALHETGNKPLSP